MGTRRLLVVLAVVLLLAALLPQVCGKEKKPKKCKVKDKDKDDDDNGNGIVNGASSECSGNGDCVPVEAAQVESDDEDGECQCFSSYTGSDCSQHLSAEVLGPIKTASSSFSASAVFQVVVAPVVLWALHRYRTKLLPLGTTSTKEVQLAVTQYTDRAVGLVFLHGVLSLFYWNFDPLGATSMLPPWLERLMYSWVSLLPYLVILNILAFLAIRWTIVSHPLLPRLQTNVRIAAIAWMVLLLVIEPVLAILQTGVAVRSSNLIASFSLVLSGLVLMVSVAALAHLLVLRRRSTDTADPGFDPMVVFASSITWRILFALTVVASVFARMATVDRDQGSPFVWFALQSVLPIMAAVLMVSCLVEFAMLGLLPLHADPLTPFEHEKVMVAARRPVRPTRRAPSAPTKRGGGGAGRRRPRRSLDSKSSLDSAKSRSRGRRSGRRRNLSSQPASPRSVPRVPTHTQTPQVPESVLEAATVLEPLPVAVEGSHSGEGRIPAASSAILLVEDQVSVKEVRPSHRSKSRAATDNSDRQSPGRTLVARILHVAGQARRRSSGSNGMRSRSSSAGSVGHGVATAPRMAVKAATGSTRVASAPEKRKPRPRPARDTQNTGRRPVEAPSSSGHGNGAGGPPMPPPPPPGSAPASGS